MSYKYSVTFDNKDEQAIRQVMERINVTDRSLFTQLAIVTFCNQFAALKEEEKNEESNVDCSKPQEDS